MKTILAYFFHNIKPITISESQLKYIIFAIIYCIVICCVMCIIGIIVFVICSYFMIKRMNNMDINDIGIFFNRYNKRSQDILDKYGECKIQSAYIIRQPLSKLLTTGINMLTFYRYNAIITESFTMLPYHSSLMVKIITPENKIKILVIEKQNCVEICESVCIHNTMEIKQLRHIKNRNLILNDVLETTRVRIGNDKFFNWGLVGKNCRYFTQELLITMNSDTPKNMEYLSRCDAITKKLQLSDFSLHITHCAISIYNVVEKICM